MRELGRDEFGELKCVFISFIYSWQKSYDVPLCLMSHFTQITLR